MTTVITEFRGVYSFLSNFARVRVMFENIAFPSVEHAYVAAKTTNKMERMRIAAMATAGEAKKYGRSLTLRPDWDSVKVGIMHDLLVQKFAEPNYRRWLLNTGDAEIQEGNYWGDRFWGISPAGSGRGENNLGKLLMSIREDLKKPLPEFRLIVAGSRGFADADLLNIWINELAENQYKDKAVSIVSGMARGADMLAWDWGKRHGVQVYEFPAEWNTYGKSAGFRRNNEMAQFADGLLAFWDGLSSGTKHMIETMEKLGKPVHVVRFT